MRQFVLQTIDEEHNEYVYFLRAKQKPTDKQIDAFLRVHGEYPDEEGEEPQKELLECVILLEEIKKNHFHEIH